MYGETPAAVCSTTSFGSGVVPAWSALKNHDVFVPVGVELSTSRASRTPNFVTPVLFMCERPLAFRAKSLYAARFIEASASRFASSVVKFAILKSLSVRLFEADVLAATTARLVEL